jgi:hypothetical protein
MHLISTVQTTTRDEGLVTILFRLTHETASPKHDKIKAV